MADKIQIALSADEIEMIIDALEADFEQYLESAKEAREEKNARDFSTFNEAAERIGALRASLRKLLPEVD